MERFRPENRWLPENTLPTITRGSSSHGRCAINQGIQCKRNNNLKSSINYKVINIIMASNRSILKISFVCVHVWKFLVIGWLPVHV